MKVSTPLILISDSSSVATVHQSKTNSRFVIEIRLLVWARVFVRAVRAWLDLHACVREFVRVCVYGR